MSRRPSPTKGPFWYSSSFAVITKVPTGERPTSAQENPSRRAHPIDRVVVYQTGLRPLIITKNEATNTVDIHPCALVLSQPQIISVSVNAILACFNSTRAHPHRLTYCTAGSKQSPGYAEFLLADNTSNQLLDFLVSSAMKSYWKFRGVLALNFLVDGEKDGMKKTGQIPWYGPAQIPEHLRHHLKQEGRFLQKMEQDGPESEKS
ncbi:hypothetical protein BCR33DRAFT_713180 [Rhizoclosmatium globosum]|uniref:Uncharacterized protein n=1 Tax=Rhizoclosmatium globosum TaxID=329046 RepID=A0A1Y2CTQ1_9FUNG|nr:hypothetical protein BCR33DRAFT_713180 [Rhizoclosmatium globosum]|eukprot:ORY50362.1 hypothetical protein BCR33DRAFT_713180 [Rhizoclosmatium globosum]